MLKSGDSEFRDLKHDFCFNCEESQDSTPKKGFVEKIIQKVLIMGERTDVTVRSN